MAAVVLFNICVGESVKEGGSDRVPGPQMQHCICEAVSIINLDELASRLQHDLEHKYLKSSSQNIPQFSKTVLFKNVNRLGFCDTSW